MSFVYLRFFIESSPCINKMLSVIPPPLILMKPQKVFFNAEIVENPAFDGQRSQRL